MANGVVLYLLARMTRGVFPPETMWMHAAPESAAAGAEAWEWRTEKDGCHVWQVSTNQEQLELDAFARARDAYPVVRGGRVEVRREDLPAVTGPNDRQRRSMMRLSPEQVFAQLEKKHLA